MHHARAIWYIQYAIDIFNIDDRYRYIELNYFKVCLGPSTDLDPSDFDDECTVIINVA